VDAAACKLPEGVADLNLVALAGRHFRLKEVDPALVWKRARDYVRDFIGPTPDRFWAVDSFDARVVRMVPEHYNLTEHDLDRVPAQDVHDRLRIVLGDVRREVDPTPLQPYTPKWCECPKMPRRAP